MISRKPANEMITDSGAETVAMAVPEPPGRSPSAGTCELCRELIELGLSRGRNAKAIKLRHSGAPSLFLAACQIRIVSANWNRA